MSVARRVGSTSGLIDLRTHAKTATTPHPRGGPRCAHQALYLASGKAVRGEWLSPGAYSAIQSIHNGVAVCDDRNPGSFLWRGEHVPFLHAGVVALPAGAAFPGVKAISKAGKRPVFFVTAGERGRLRIWR